MKRKFDFSGWATKNDLKCADGRTIRHGAFTEDDGKKVPLVWQHMHDSPNNVLGHAVLEDRDDGVYAYAKFNDTEIGQRAKALVKHGDITSLSIHANNLKQIGGDVIHGIIREVSLVLAGANPGAIIDFPVLEHSGETVYDEAIIFTGANLKISHSLEEEELDDDYDFEEIDDEEDDDDFDDFDDFDDEDDDDDEEGPSMEHSAGGKTLQEAFNEFSEEQKTVVYAIAGMILEDQETGGDNMKHNVFEGKKEEKNVLSHDAMRAVIDDAVKIGTLKESMLQHGITDISILFPDAQTLTNEPFMYKDQNTATEQILSGIRKSPFARVKTIIADLTPETCRAKGYITGAEKFEQVFGLLTRSTDPQTVYKKQKLDRDDIIDITDFDVVSFINREMRMFLNEEIARCVLKGDGRQITDADKVKEDKIRPIFSDVDLYTIKATAEVDSSDVQTYKSVITAAIKARKTYQGSGSPKAYMSPDMLANLLLMEDGFGHALYKTEAELATKMRVSGIVETSFMGDLEILICNLNDYTLGANKGGQVTTFDDFDIDFNQNKYLIETRLSGALTIPKSAIAITVTDTFTEE